MPKERSATRKLIIVGAGGHAKVVAETSLAAGYDIVGFVDDFVNQAPLPGYRVLGTSSVLNEIMTQYGRDVDVFVAIGDNSVRKCMSLRIADFGVPFAILSHPSSCVSQFAQLNEGTIVMPGVIVNAGTVVGRHVILNTSCSVDHDCVIADFSHISPGVHVAGGVKIGEGCHIGIGASVVPGVTIGEWTVVGSGAAVVNDLPAHVVAVGVPARIIKRL